MTQTYDTIHIRATWQDIEEKIRAIKPIHKTNEELIVTIEEKNTHSKNLAFLDNDFWEDNNAVSDVSLHHDSYLYQ